jgi:hypothetical protein
MSEIPGETCKKITKLQRIGRLCHAVFRLK